MRAVQLTITVVFQESEWRLDITDTASEPYSGDTSTAELLDKRSNCSNTTFFPDDLKGLEPKPGDYLDAGWPIPLPSK